MADFDPWQFSEDIDDLARSDFAFFVMRAFEELYEQRFYDNWHIYVIAHWVMEATFGNNRRLIITMPPRFLKSFICSICLPAFILGHNPGERIVCASYAQKLSEEFAFETRRLMEGEWYCRLFPGTRLDPKKRNLEALTKTRGGQRRATSVGGSLTGFGGNFVLIDDPIKALDAHSEVARDGAINWFGGTVASRLDEPKKGRIIVIAQRLHLEDLPGHLLQQGIWRHLDLPLIEWKDRDVEIAPGRFVERKAGDLLHPERIDREEIEHIRSQMGERDFEAQYNQRPMPPGGALFKGEWFQRYDEPPGPHQIEGRFQSWDTAYDIEEQHDYSVCTTWALSGANCFLLDVYRAKLEFPELEKAIYSQRAKWNADLVIVEAIGSGKSVFQNIRNRDRHSLWLQALAPAGSKQHRASQQTSKFERGEIWLPVEAPWLRTFEDEFLSFPNGRNDDQVDSVVQFLAALDTGNLLRRKDHARRR